MAIFVESIGKRMLRVVVEKLILSKSDWRSGVVPLRSDGLALVGEGGDVAETNEVGAALKKKRPNSSRNHIILGLTGRLKRQWAQKLWRASSHAASQSVRMWW